MPDGVFSVSDYARKWRKENFGAVFGRLCGIVIFRVMGAEFPAGYVYVSLPFCRDTVFMPLCAGKSTVAFGHVVSVFFPGFHVYAESAFKFNRPWLICAVLAF